MIVIGTALAVPPFCKTLTLAEKDIPKVLINLENTKSTLPDYDFDNLYSYPERLFLKGKCDDIIQSIVKDAGWESEFKPILNTQ